MNSWPLLTTEPITTNLTWSFCTYQALLSRQLNQALTYVTLSWISCSGAELEDGLKELLLGGTNGVELSTYVCSNPVPIPNQTVTHQSKGNGIKWNGWKFTLKKLSCSAFWSGNRARKLLISNKWNSPYQLCFYTAIS